MPFDASTLTLTCTSTSMAYKHFVSVTEWILTTPHAQSCFPAEQQMVGTGVERMQALRDR